MAALKKAGVNPYPARVNRSFTCAQALAGFNQLSEQAEELSLVGRLRAIRGHGGSTFAQIEDGTGQLQIYFKKDQVGEKDYQFFQENFDLGDFIEVKGTLFLTKKQEKTLLVDKFRILAKSLAPLPEKWHGLREVEERFRKRYLDLLFNKQVREKFEKRSRLYRSLREFLDGHGFIEVETPILQDIPGGALARPFKTHHNALDLDLYLRIAPELYLKRLLAGGLEKVYEIGRCFRNEGLDASHNPDFTMLEFYWAYADYRDMMDLVEEMFVFLLKELNQSDSLVYQGEKIKFTRPFKRIEFAELGKDDQEIKNKIKAISQPTFIIHHPAEISPLAKPLEENPEKAERFQLVAGGLELVNAFSELNDPIKQDEIFKQQEKMRQKGDQEAQRYDQEFIEALEYGMPPAAGMGMGLDRLAALLTDSKTLREIILFPLMRPKK